MRGFVFIFFVFCFAVFHNHAIAVFFEVEENLKDLTLEEAIGITLQNQRDIKISQMLIAEQRGIIQNSAGPFDIIMNANIDYFMRQDRQDFPTGIKSDFAAHETIATIEYTKLTRVGTRFRLFAEGDQIIDPLGAEPVVGSVPAKKTDQGILIFEVEQPLLRGFVNGNSAIAERANRRQLTAVVLDNLHLISQKIDDTTEQYWELVAAQDILKIRQDTVKRFEELLKNTEILVHDEELAKSDVLQPQSQLAQSKVAEILATQRVYAAVQTLLLRLGLAEEGVNYDVLSTRLNHHFPEIPEDLPITMEIAAGLVSYASWNRNDIRAAKVRETVADILIVGGYNDLLPQLNIIAGMNRHDFLLKRRANPIYRALGMPHPQVDYSIGVHLSVPMCNDAAKGTLYQRKAIRQRLAFQTQQLIQDTYEEILNAWSNQIAVSHSLKENAVVVEKNKALVDNESKKLKEGFSTLFVLIDFENRLTGSLVERVELKRQYMQNIVRIRYLTGSLIKPNASLWCYRIEDVQKLPGESLFRRQEKKS